MANKNDPNFHFDNAPIVEALIDFRVRPTEGFAPENLLALQPLIQDKYSAFAPARQFQTVVGIQDGKPITPSLTDRHIGFRVESLDKRYVFQPQVHGFTLSRLRPYETWEALRDEARWLWDAYRKIANPVSVTRTALRYINRIEIPIPVNFDAYFTNAPGIPRTLPQVTAGYLSRIVIPFNDTGIQIIITQAFDPLSSTSPIASVLLDIDVALEKPFDVESEDYWGTLEQIRHLKNEAFRGSLTKKALGLFK